MSFVIDLNETIGATLRRIAAEQIDKAIAEIHSELPESEKVHQVRKRCKKMRALLRLVREHDKTLYREENAFYRDLGRSLAADRDAAVLSESLDLIWPASLSENIRAIFHSKLAKTAEMPADTGQRLLDSAERLASAKERIEHWHLQGEFALILPGLKQTYRDGKKRLKATTKAPTPEHLHELRKSLKYHRYQIQMLLPIWTDELTVRYAAADQVGESLGIDHDLAILAEKLKLIDLDAQHLALLQTKIEERRMELQKLSLLLTRQLLAEGTKAFAKRHRSYHAIAASRSGP